MTPTLPYGANGAGRIPPLADPDNPESELSPSDLRQPEPYPSVPDELINKLVDERFEEARQARLPFEARWMEALAFYNGDSWSRWDTRSARMVSVIDARERHRIYARHNKIKPRANKLVARAMSGKTDASVAPLTTSPHDLSAAQEARAVLAHFDKIFSRDSQNRDMATHSIVVGPAFLKIGFDPTAVVPVPLMQDPANPEAVTGVQDAQVGEVFEDIVPGVYLYPDPKGTRWNKDINWVIQAQQKSLSFVQERWPDRGFLVKGDGSNGAIGWIQSAIRAVTGTHNLTAEATKNSVTVKEMWEMPSLRFPLGRYVVTAGGIVLCNQPWPYHKLAKMRMFPYVPLMYRSGILTFWGDNAVSDSVEPPVDYNRAVSSVQEHISEGRGKILAPRGCEIKADDFKTGRRDEIIPYTVAPENGGAKPEFFPTPPMDPAILTSMEVAQNDIDDLFEVHDVSNGGVPPRVSSGIAIQTVGASDQSAAQLFQEAFNFYHVTRATIELAIAGEFYIDPRLIFVQDTPPEARTIVPGMEGQVPGMGQPGAPGIPSPQGPPAGAGQQVMPPFAGAGGVPAGATGAPPFAPACVQQRAQGPGVGMAGGNPAATQVMMFKSLGIGRTSVKATSSTPKTPEARQQQLIAMFQAGMFDPERIPTTLALLEALDVEQPDKLTADIMAKLRQFQEMQPGPQQQAQMQMQQAQLQAQIQAMLLGAKQSVLDHSAEQADERKLAIEMAKQRTNQAGEMQKLGAEHQHAAQQAKEENRAAKLSQGLEGAKP